MPAFISVIRRAEEFRQLVQRHNPELTREECFLMWLQTLRSSDQISVVSARQYMTYYHMSLKSPFEAYSRALKLKCNRFQQHEAKMAKVPSVRTIAMATLRTEPIFAAALALQLALGARWVDLELLERQHVQLDRLDVPPGTFMVTMVGGKTDPESEGQSLLLPKSGHLSAVFLQWLQSIPAEPTLRIFEGLTYERYNAFTKTRLGVSTRFVRHAALNSVASILGEQAAKALGRHRTISSSRNYISRAFWGPTQKSLDATRTVQRIR
ncbi:hypothetical protein DIPPA_11418 [Diplonema papillatum]|nr:hypothetical protein DIPPA_11418 [Diplonema papillatum]